MKVSELAVELNTDSAGVLKMLKSLKLKAKDQDQVLSVAVISVLKSQFSTTDKAVDSEKKKKAVKKTVTKKKAVKKKEPATELEKAKPKTKKAVKKKAISTKDVETAPAAKTKSIASSKAKKSSSDTKDAGTEPKVKKVASTTVSKKESGDDSKKKTTVKKVSKGDAPRSYPKISNAPMITLKPLARKRKKSAGGGDGSAASQSKEDIKVSTIPGEDLQKIVSQDDQVEAPQAVARSEGLPDIEVQVPITVKELSVKLQEKPSVVLKYLMKMGALCHINQSLNADVVSRIVQNFGFNLAKIQTREEKLIEVHKEEEVDKRFLNSRPPVITFMGHVDHGKTTLLDWVRKSKIATSEHGGITQHMGAYSVEVGKGTITFFDTPGHEAFTAMRARGAHITDIVVLIVAADEGVMPQTLEAIDHARAADVPIIVALTKIDKKNADMDRVKKQLSEHNLMSEDWGGKTIVAGVSGTTGEGVEALLEMILLESEMLELKANEKKKASGIVVEAHLSHGKGVVTTLIVQSGTLRYGDIIVLGPYYGKVRAMFDSHGITVKEAGPSIPVEVLGLSNVPEAGEMFYSIDNEKQAREITERRQEEIKDQRLHATPKVTLEDLHEQLQEGAIKELNVILKSDVKGSLEALKDSLEKIPSDRVKVRFIHSAVGDVNASDVLLALASKAIIIAFHVGVDARAKKEVEKELVDVREYRIIYDAVDDMKKALEGLLEAKIERHFLGRVEIREVFKLSKQGIVAGCYVQKGKVHRKAHADIVRDGDVIFSGVIGTLKRFKDDVRDVTEGMECGIKLDGFDKYEKEDVIEAYEVESIAQKL